MAHPKLIETMRAQDAFADLLPRLPGPGGAVSVGGLPGSGPSVLLAALAEAEPRRLWVVVAGTPARAETVQADLVALLGEEHAALYPQREALPYEAAEPHLEVSGLRVEALEALLSGRVRILVTTARALQELAEIPRALTELRLTLELRQRVRPQDLVERLEALGFERAPLVQGVGEYALRGGIVDLFGFGSPDPVRVEFWGDEIVSLRHFDILDQRSTGAVERVDVLPVDFRSVLDPDDEGSERRSLLDVVPRDAVLMEWPDDLDAEEGEQGVAAREAQLRALFERTWEEVLHLNEAERRRGGSPEAPQTLFLPPERALARLRELGRMAVVPLRDAEVAFRARPPEAIERDTDRLAALLETGAARGEDTLILCDNPGQLERLEELLGGPAGLPARASLALGTVAAGFVLEGAEPPLRVLTDHEIFRRERRLRRGRRFQGAVALESLSQLKPGDYVVHLDHGVGRFRGLERVRVAEEEIESLSIEYAGGEILRVPIYRLDLVERWVPDRDEAPAPRVHKIGGKAWKTLRRKTEQAIQEMAAELLELYAAREMAEGHAFSADTRWQREMESAFLYEDTPDQRKATADVKADMEAKRPMDRLICGDVGYGKTEVAIRAAFKAVQDGKQVAVLAPTTILVEQHAHTFAERLAGFPIKIEAISRFRSAREQTEILAGLADGSLDIVVGTHRLLQPDLLFKDLGLLVVDEEQRFGVKHKERLKDLKKNVDVLSLTATPIPRTLSMAISGLRDLTLIQTPPRDRMPVLTHVLPWHDEVLEDALRRELDRGGQVFFVHNRVQSIGPVAERVRALVPDAEVDVAHGQMGGAELEEVMRRFLDGEVDVLVCTSIIENGLDVPSANTLVVHRADQFGLSQLYQLRGRVGRSHHRAYCYLLVPDEATEEAERRLRILEHFTELGSGYAIAIKDLELRGGGNILGAEQSGFVHAVGIDTYTRLLEDTVRRMREGEDVTRWPAPEVNVEGAAYLTDAYVPEPAQKLHLYRRISRLEEVGDVAALETELRDRYGPPPPEVHRLLVATRLRILGQALGVERVLVRPDDARLTFRAGAVPRMATLQNAFRDRQIEVEVRRAMPLSLVLRRYGAEPLTDTLSAALAMLADGQARAA